MTRDLTPDEMGALIAADKARVKAEIAEGLSRLGRRPISPAPPKPETDLDAVRAALDTRETP